VDVNGLAIVIAIIHHTFYVRMYYEAGVVPLGDNGALSGPAYSREVFLAIDSHS
jgi:hypothetical protein